MKKSKLIGAMLLSACMITGSAMPAMADAVKVVTLGADLNQDQKDTMMRYFKTNYNEVQVLTITNQDERDHLSAYVPLEQIGTRTVSCAYVKPTQSGGIKVRTANLNWVTGNMIATTLSTSGVRNCEVIAACPFEVSGTGALTGIQMAYETASGEKLDETKKEIATQEMVVTGKLAEQVGQNDAITIVNQAKMQVIADNIQDADEIYNIVVNIADMNGISINDEQISKIVSLLTELVQQDYSYEDMKETLERVDENVTGETNGETADAAEEDPDSIMNGVDESILGEDVISSSTEDPTLEEETQEDPTLDEENGEYVEVPAEGEDNYGEIEETPEIPESEGSDRTEVAIDYLSEDAQAKYKDAETFCKGEFEGDTAALQSVMGEDAVVSVFPEAEVGAKLSEKVLDLYLGILGNGTDSYVPGDEDKYMTVELNMLEKELKKVFVLEETEEELTEEENMIVNALIWDDRQILLEDTMKFFEKLYGESLEVLTETESMEAVDETAEEMPEETYYEENGEESYEEMPEETYEVPVEE